MRVTTLIAETAAIAHIVIRLAEQADGQSGCHDNG